jgi:hypothetical protein
LEDLPRCSHKLSRRRHIIARAIQRKNEFGCIVSIEAHFLQPRELTSNVSVQNAWANDIAMQKPFYARVSQGLLAKHEQQGTRIVKGAVVRSTNRICQLVGGKENLCRLDRCVAASNIYGYVGSSILASHNTTPS